MRAALLLIGLVASGIPDRAWADAPKVRSRTAVVIDAGTGEELYGKDADAVRPIASTTKIFVAMAVRKHALDLDGWTTITKADAREAAGGARTRLDVGQAFRNRDLLRAMLIASDNRAPTALARGAGMEPDALVAAMNDVAKDLGLKKTRFTDPSGLHGNTSTAREMAVALRAALKDDVLRSIMGQESAEVVSKGGGVHVTYSSTNVALRAHQYDVVGGKTGYTEPAGYCLVTAARINKRDVVMAFYGGDSKGARFADFNKLAGWLEHTARSPVEATLAAAGAAIDSIAPAPASATVDGDEPEGKAAAVAASMGPTTVGGAPAAAASVVESARPAPHKAPAKKRAHRRHHRPAES
ncbi:MAG TPA: serine hydrolase [Kofleriaceae bacterium]|jgi:D-alanyl-D-alanine endopeptidase (penicillin-binding protein 7)